MAKRRRRRVRLGASAAEHARELPTVLTEIDDRVKQAKQLLANGLCRQATDHWATAENLKGMALIHAKGGKHGEVLNRRKVNTFLELARLRLKVLETCTRDD